MAKVLVINIFHNNKYKKIIKKISLTLPLSNLSCNNLGLDAYNNETSSNAFGMLKITKSYKSLVSSYSPHGKHLRAVTATSDLFSISCFHWQFALYYNNILIRYHGYYSIPHFILPSPVYTKAYIKNIRDVVISYSPCNIKIKVAKQNSKDCYYGQQPQDNLLTMPLNTLNDMSSKQIDNVPLAKTTSLPETIITNNVTIEHFYNNENNKHVTTLRCMV
ncbi:hypothetical protein IAH97_00380 [Neoehrlichia mikurensis]|uniref:Uncharacterized protein n=1 Tax=Neoehrlichia mikurensis TaxID=89586 RepID=A0A9Q9BRJ6_9RICK|nr:hypothetical protein [Neoehrlichia mikurensis]QXK92033.1 hypothetical protein IAH97_00380 [Neoehrlichia mikurensis]UTO55300.1 hypothetical protein LUA82_03900 [Neoehrlichia mikurensis]UTO56220.1 hypothetical protein LUA81_03865 [Neoehrlichia mikurensis]